MGRSRHYENLPQLPPDYISNVIAYISYLSNIETTLREGIPRPGFPVKVLFVGKIC